MSSYKSFWCLNVDEAIVAGKLKEYFKKDAEVFLPLNAQLKDIDLIISDLNKRKMLTIQVKGSKAYEPSKKEREKYGNGSVGWFFIDEKIINECSADYFIFLIHTIEDYFENNENRKRLSAHLLTICPSDLKKICGEQKILHKRYSFYIWIDSKGNRAFDYRDSSKKGIIELKKYLNDAGLIQLKEKLR